MSFFEISPLCNYNIKESFAELSRIVLKRHGMDNLWKWKHNSGMINFYLIDFIWKIRIVQFNVV